MDSLINSAGVAEVWQTFLTLKALLVFAWSVLVGFGDWLGNFGAGIGGFSFSVISESAFDSAVDTANSAFLGIAAGFALFNMDANIIASALDAELIAKVFEKLGDAGVQFAKRASNASAVVVFMLGAYSSIFVVQKGFRLMRGVSSGSLPEFLVDTLKLMGIASFAGVATQFDLIIGYMDLLQNVLANLISGSEDGIVNMGAVGTQGVDKQDKLKSALTLLLKLVFFGAAMMGNTLSGTLGPATPAEGSALVTFSIVAMPMIGGALSFVVSTLSVLLLCKLAWGFLIGLGPIFIFSLAFKFTSSLFRSWFNNILYVILLASLTTWLVKYILLPIVLLQFANGMLKAIQSMQTSNLGGQSMGLLISMQAGVVGMLTAIVTGFIPRLVGALTNTNAVSGFESMGTMLGGGMEKAGSTMQTIMNKDKHGKATPDKATGDTADNNGSGTRPAYTVPQKTSNSGAADAKTATDNGRAVDGARGSTAAAQSNGGGGGNTSSSPAVRDSGSQAGTGGRLASPSEQATRTPTRPASGRTDS